MKPIKHLDDFLNRRVELVHPHPFHGKQGWTNSHHTENGRTWLVVELDNGDEVTITDPQQLWFLTGAVVMLNGPIIIPYERDKSRNFFE